MFWEANTDNSLIESSSLFIKPLNSYVSSDSAGGTYLINGGINSMRYPTKYNKFSYSSTFPQSLDKKYIDNAFVFLYKNKRLLKDTIRENRLGKNTVIYLRWGINAIPKLDAYSTLVPIEDGYVLVSNIYSSIVLKFIFCGFCVPRHNFKIEMDNNSINIHSGNLTSSLRAVYKELKMRYAFVAPKRMLSSVESVVPYFSASIYIGENRIISCVQGGKIIAPYSIDTSLPEEVAIRFDKKQIVLVRNKSRFFEQKGIP